MSHFYGTIEGQAKIIATRIGTKKSGLVTICASYQGAIRCYAYVNKAGVDCVRIRKVLWLRKGDDELLYSGPIGVPSQDAP